MTRSKLIQKVQALNPSLTLQQAEECVMIIFNKITQTLQLGGRVELRGFGIFTVRQREARAGRNPRTGESVEIQHKMVPFFKAGKELRDRINSLSEVA